MKRMISRLQQDIHKLQETVQTLQKEGGDLLEKMKKVDLKENIESAKNEWEKHLLNMLKKLEPAYQQLMGELKKHAKKAGIDLDKIEKDLVQKAELASEKLKKVRMSAKMGVQKKAKAADKAGAMKGRRGSSPMGRSHEKKPVTKKTSSRQGRQGQSKGGHKPHVSREH